MESYYQEVGRAGRDGLPANTWLAYGFGDVATLRHIVDSSEADEQRKWLERRKLNALLGFCETTRCRREAMLQYFGETYTGPCNNCDNCLEPIATWDGKVAAQMALSCIYRTDQRFGVKHLVDVLTGKITPQIERFQHDKISTFGIGKDYTATQWQSIYRQLAAADYLSVDLSGFGSVRLTEKSRALLRGEETIALRKDPEHTRKTKSGSKRNNPSQSPQMASGKHSKICALASPKNKASRPEARALRRAFYSSDRGMRVSRCSRINNDAKIRLSRSQHPTLIARSKTAMAIPRRRLLNSLPVSVTKFIFNLWPPFWGAGIRVKYIAPDFREVKVVLKLHWYNRNFMGVHFGGSLYSMTDAFPMVMTARNLGPDYIVWIKPHGLIILNPAKGPCTRTSSFLPNRSKPFAKRPIHMKNTCLTMKLMWSTTRR
ncbi:unnamed protein product [Sphagnum balticum]